MRLLVGGYSADIDGAAEGIGMLRLGDDDSAAGASLSFEGTVATTDSPSWLAAHPTLDVVYAALEGRADVQAFVRTDDARWTPLGTPASVGALPCHILAGRERLFVSCWGSGDVVQLDLAPDGSLRSPVIADAAVDPYGGSGEERVARAHQSIVVAPGQVATTDMGFDLVRFWRTGTGAPRRMQEVVLPRGTGPRHGILHPSGHLFVVTELSRELFVLARDDAGTWRVVGATSLAGGLHDEDAAAELAVSRDGTLLYAGVRGSDTIAVLRVTGAGGSVSPLALVEAGVHWPRHHVLTGDGVLVAGQRSSEVALLPLDARGIPGRARTRTEVPSPTCLLPMR